MKILIVYWSTLEPDKSAGCLRLFEICKILIQIGHDVTFVHPKGTSVVARNLGIESIFGLEDIENHPRMFQAYLLLRQFDVAILSPYIIYANLANKIKKVLPRCHMVLDTIDLFHLRMQRKADLTGDESDVLAARNVYQIERDCMERADSVWVVSTEESNDIQPYVKRTVAIPTIHKTEDRRLPYERRKGIVFLGGFAHQPNVDAVAYFCEKILPAVREMLPDIPVTIAGSNPTAEVKNLAERYSVQVVGYIADHRALLKSARVGIAPLRFGAGMKGKIGEYLACGLPCVTTTVGAEGLKLINGENAMIKDDPYEFASAVVSLYTDPVAWEMISKNGAQLVDKNFSPKSIANTISSAFCIDYSR